ncbi:MAG: ATP-binding cassette domain-containing protein [bacterium]
MIQIKKLTKVYPNGYELFKELDLFIGENEFVFLVGPSGSGKSSLLNIFFLLESITSGYVYIDNVCLNHLKSYQIPYLRRNIGFVFQDFKLLLNRSVFENVAYALRILNFSRRQISSQVRQVLDLVGLQHRIYDISGNLSGGEQQRLCIARAIVNNPAILLADEPTGNLDPDASEEIIQLLSKINARHTTVLVATHDQMIVNKMRKRVVVLNKGTIIRDQQFGTYAEVLSV